MKAAVLEKVGQLDIRDIPVPECTPGTVLVKVEACAVCATDVKVYRHGHRLIKPPRVTGHEVSGTVVKSGKGVEGFNEGDRIAVAPAIPCGKCLQCRRGAQNMCLNLTAMGYHYDGGFAEYMLLPEVAVSNGCLSIMPDGIAFEEAALAEPLACVINCHERMGVSVDDTVVILGAGPLGILHIQVARARGAKKIILIEVQEERLRKARSSGADVYVNGSKENAVDRVLEETSGMGAEDIIVACGSGAAQEQALGMAATRGKVNFFGGLPKDASIIRFDSNIVHYKEVWVTGTHGSSPRHNELAVSLIGSGKINVKGLITHRLMLDEILRGIEITEKGEGLRVIVTPE